MWILKFKASCRVRATPAVGGTHWINTSDAYMADLPVVVFKAGESAKDPLIPNHESLGNVGEASLIHLPAKFSHELPPDPDYRHCDVSYVALSSHQFEASTAASASDAGNF